MYLFLDHLGRHRCSTHAQLLRSVETRFRSKEVPETGSDSEQSGIARKNSDLDQNKTEDFAQLLISGQAFRLLDT